ncbi:MAG: MerR family transcriptional regulator [Deltaproteobacteria bacterium]|nr:MAG: MerR family transcriptional regulator [Deltaproteobacteria bacterium]
MEGLRTGELAIQGGVNLETIRYYERRGLLPKPPRTSAGYRAFDAEAVRRLRFIKQAQALGFSLKEVRELLALRLNPRTSCADVRRRAEAKIADIEEKLRGLRAMKKVLVRITAVCAGRGPVSECPILESLEERGR